MCEICNNLKNEEFININEWNVFDLQLTRLIFKNKMIEIQYNNVIDAYLYQCSKCTEIWQLKEPLFALSGIVGYFTPNQIDSN